MNFLIMLLAWHVERRKTSLNEGELDQVNRIIVEPLQEMIPINWSVRIIGKMFLPCQLTAFQSGMLKGAYIGLAMALLSFFKSLLVPLVATTQKSGVSCAWRITNYDVNSAVCIDLFLSATFPAQSCSKSSGNYPTLNAIKISPIAHTAQIPTTLFLL